MADREREVATRRTSIEQSEATARSEIREGRFNNERVHLERAERVGWNDQDEDAVLLLQRALAKVHVFEHWNWWNHLTPLDIGPAIQDQLRPTVYCELCLLVAMRLHWGILSFDNLLEFSQGTNGKLRQILTDALVPIQAARRFRTTLGLEFANALCEAQSGELVSLPKLSAVAFKYLGKIDDPKMLRNPVVQYFIGICMLY